MPIETYRLEVRDANDEGIDADVYGSDDVIEASTRVSYDDYAVEPTGDRDDPEPRVREVTADVTALDLQVERDDAGFTFRLLGDRDDIATERVDDADWGLE